MPGAAPPAPAQKQRLQPKPAPGAPPPSPVQAPGMPGQAAPGVVQQGNPPSPAPPQQPGQPPIPGPAPGADQPGNMSNLPPAPGQAPPNGLATPGAPGMNPGMGNAVAPAAGMQEPYGAQVARRIHEDHSLLMQDYDQMMGLLENEPLKQLVFDLLTGIDASLTSIESFFQQQYGHLAPLEGAMPADQGMMAPGAPPAAPGQAPPGAAPPGAAPGGMPGDVPPEGMPPGEEGVPEEGMEDGPPGEEEGDPSKELGSGEKEESEEKPKKKDKGEKSLKALTAKEEKEGKDVTDASTDAMPANSGKAMGKKPNTLPKREAACPKCGKVECSCKNRNRSGKGLCPSCKCAPCGCGTKSMCPKCSNSPCTCSGSPPPMAGAMTKDHLGDEEGGEDGPSFGDSTGGGGGEAGSLLSAALLKHELKWAKEAHDYLDELSCCQNFGEEGRMKSYAFHKMLGEIAGTGSTAASASFPSSGQKGIGDKDLEGGDMAGGEMMPSAEKSIHPHRLKCAGASKFYKALSNERAYGDRHREMAKFHHEGMRELFEAVEEKIEDEIEEQTGESLEGGQEGEDASPDEANVGEPRTKEDEMEGGDEEEASADDFRKALEESDAQQKAIDALLKELSFVGAAA